MTPMDSDDTERIEEIRAALEELDVFVESIDSSANGGLLDLTIRGSAKRKR